jgi:hypothetical protein
MATHSPEPQRTTYANCTIPSFNPWQKAAIVSTLAARARNQPDPHRTTSSQPHKPNPESSLPFLDQ